MIQIQTSIRDSDFLPRKSLWRWDKPSKKSGVACAKVGSEEALGHCLLGPKAIEGGKWG